MANMKNVLVYIHPSKRFRTAYYHREMEFLVKVQIDNSLAWGWKEEDIIIATNFPYSYNGIESVVVPDDTWTTKKRTTSKINALLALYDMGLITDQLYWFHDFDAFQNDVIHPIDLEDKKIAITHSSVNTSRYSTGIIFFSKQSKDIFTAIVDKCSEYMVDGELKVGEEEAFNILVRNNINNINSDILTLNISHNFAIKKRDVAAQYIEAEKPIKVLHFHPYDLRSCQTEIGKTSLQVVYGDNSLGVPLMQSKLKDIFVKHGL